MPTPKGWTKRDFIHYKILMRSCKAPAFVCRTDAVQMVNKLRKVWYAGKGLDGLSSIPPPIPAAARRKCVAWRYVGNSRRCEIFANETGHRRAKAPPFKLRPLEGIYSR